MVLDGLDREVDPVRDPSTACPFGHESREQGRNPWNLVDLVELRTAMRVTPKSA
jgi:hypothetical protein